MTEHLVIIQARLTSTRLPEKVLAPIGGQPLLRRLLDRLAPLDDVIVATSSSPDDLRIIQLCHAWNVRCVQGPLDDVLGRFLIAANTSPAKAVVRLTADNPTVDRLAVERALEAFEHRPAGSDGVSNHHPARRDPYGYAVEVVATDALRSLDQQLAKSDRAREHVLSPLTKAGRISPFDIGHGDWADLRWTVDYPLDFNYISDMFCALEPRFTLEDAVRWSRDHPHPTA